MKTVMCSVHIRSRPLLGWVLWTLVQLSTAIAQYGYGSTPSGTVNVQVVKVSDSNGTLRFFPDDIQADPGDIVLFYFYPQVLSSTGLMVRTGVGLGG